ncbi:MAG TPA: SbcC/MukB-like Walker B domain-containing protein, partial [Sandaracinaceae bacterium LLY-WYZ-13_1]|nr:SbcC/MukB-like Walker B domain-containing protein [Sandaracinaceae bacterium LLY-WYZ-13_1]
GWTAARFARAEADEALRAALAMRPDEAGDPHAAWDDEALRAALADPAEPGRPPREAERRASAGARAGQAACAERGAGEVTRSGAGEASLAPAAVEAALRDRVERARAAFERAQTRFEEAQRADVEAAERRRRAEEAAKEARAEGDGATARLAAALERAGLTEAEARERLAVPRSEVDGWRGELQRLDRSRSELAAVCAERARKRQLHEETDPPRVGPDEAERAMGAAERRAVETRELLLAQRSRLEQDTRLREEAGRIRKAIAAQRERLAVWETLSDLIGSGNGHKLRVFAQSLTLELLLEHANHHLRDLAPRYALSRVPGEDLSLQVVDHDMGDEVRAVGSLSGGESFLVALGLALGLASLSSQQARVDSLFIDEGFGALDPASLEMVLSTLDALQATGRQVGLISHVTTVAERFDTRVQVVPAGPARSRVELVDGVAEVFPAPVAETVSAVPERASVRA